MSKTLKLFSAILLCQAAAALGAAFTAPAVIDWYQTLNKPSFNPPDWVFAPVWTLLFLLMGFSLYLVWQKYQPKYNLALLLFFVQLALNVLWSALFFGLHNPALAFVEIVLLWLFILFTLLAFKKISKLASLLLLPYLLWVSFALILNLFLVTLN